MESLFKKLLLVDDSPEIGEIYREILPAYHYDVETAETASEGLQLLHQNKYDIILLDMRLPDSTGEEIFIELQSNPDYNLNCDVPVAIFTGYPDDTTRLRLLDMGVVAYLVKPFDPKALASVLDNLLETERRRFQLIRLSRQLEELHRFNNLVFNALPSGLIILDVLDRVVLANRMAYQILGKNDDEMKGADLRDIIGKAAFDHIISQVDLELSLNREIEIEFYEFTITIGFTVGTLTNREEKNIGKVLIFRDITSIKALAEETRRVERLASMGTLASGIAHEVKNPLAGIKAMAQVIESSVQHDQQLYGYSRRIIGQVDRLNDLLNSFFSIARQQKTERRIFPLDSVFREVIPVVAGTAKKKQVEIELDAPDEVEVFARPDQLQQVLLNLVLNAIKAAEPNTSIRIEVDRPITHPARRSIFGPNRSHERPIVQPANSVAIRVIDHGPGIPGEQIKRIFDPFFTTKEEGTGLGLFIVHQLVNDELGGQIDVISEPGETVFAFILPTLPLTITSEPYPLDLHGEPGYETVSQDG